MTPTEIKQLLNAIEEDLPVSRWQVDGVPVWPIFRIWFVFAHDEFAGAVERAGGGRIAAGARVLSQLGRGIGQYVKATVGDREHRESGGLAAAVFFTQTTCRVFQVEGRWYDQFCEPVCELLDQRGYRSLLLEHAPRDEYRVPRSRDSQFVQPELSLISLANDLARLRPVPGERELATYFAKHHPGLTISFDGVRRRVHTIRPYARYFKRQLERSRAKIGFVVNYYDLPAMAFTLACRELGIPSVDIQHGGQGDLHLAYSNWRNLPPTGYSVLPTMFWCWSETEAVTIRAWSEPVARWHRPVVAGNLVLGKFMRDDDPMVQRFDREVAAKTGATNILITLRPRGGMPPLLRAAIDAAPASWTWWIRLHPAMLDERSAVDAAVATVRDRVVVDEATRLPLYAVLRHMDAHVTEISSVVLEADQFGVPSVLCHPTGVEYYASLVRSAVGAFTAVEIVETLHVQCARELPRIPVSTIDLETLSRLVEEA